MISQQVGPDRHVVLVLDGASWHVAKVLCVPANVTLLHLPSYAPELNPIERDWGYLRSHHMSNRDYQNYDELFEHTADSWRKLDEHRLRSITATEWVTYTNQG
jgi:transposase